MLQKTLARRVVAAARRFQDRQPWLEFTDRFLFAFEVPGEPLPIHAIVLGAGGREFGLSIYLGERSLEQVYHVTTGPQPPLVAPMLLLGFDPIGAVEPGLRELTRLAGAEDRVIPTVLSIAVGGRRQPATPNQLRLVAQIVEAMLLADENDLLRPRPIDLQRGGKVLTLTIAGEAGKVHGVSARFVAVPALPGLDPAPEILAATMSELPVVDGHRVVGFEPSPFEVADQPNRPWLVFVVDPSTDQLLGMRVVPLDEPDELDEAVRAVARIFAAPKHGEPGLPRRLTIVHDRLANALAGLAERGVTIEAVEQHPSASSVFEHLLDHFSRGADDDTTLPTADDQPRWIAHHRRLHDRIGDALERVDLLSHTALAAFFGDAVVHAELDDAGATLHRTAYCDWYVTHFRGKSGRRTIAERLLAGSMPAAERCLLLARVVARAGLWVVAARRPPIVALRDAISGDEVEIHDAPLAATTDEGSALSARIADAAGHRFVIAVGPMLPPSSIDGALAHLRELFGSFSSTDLQQRPEMLAALWGWVLEEDT